MQKAKRQHYVPKFYLKKFCNSNDQIIVFNKFTNLSFPSNVENVASENYFNEIPTSIMSRFEEYLVNRASKNEDDAQHILSQARSFGNKEIDLSKIETNSSQLIENILEDANKGKEISSKNKHKMAYYIAIQWMRTRDFRQYVIEALEKLKKAELEAVLKLHKIDYSPSDFDVTLNSDMASLMHMAYLSDTKVIDELQALFEHHIWYIGINNTDEPFITSDTPVVRHPWGKNSGLHSEGIQITFPLTPNHILILLERTFFKEAEIWENKSITLTKENILFYNDLQVLNSYRQIFSPLNNFLFAQELCRKYPEICDPKRGNITVTYMKS